jgi:peptidoglycan/LPS O-acetylase OafA/YrhL
MADRGTFAGFDGLRLFGAVSVMFSHAFLIATGSEDTEPFIRLLGPGNLLGLYGVFTFFIISGFLLTRSLQSRPSAITYSVNRALRILPGFLFCTFLTVAVIGPLFTTLTVKEYFSSPETLEYVRRTLSILNDYGLPGVYGGPEGHITTVVNGSLWSLHYEALSYVFLLLVWTIAPSSRIAALVAVILSVLIWVFPGVSKAIASVAYTLPYFAGGVLMQWIHSRFGITRLGAAISLVLLLASCLFGWQSYAFALFGAYLIVFLGERPNVGSWIARKFGDCSYGIYLFGWPAEQMVRKLTNTTDPWLLFVMALPLAALLGWISFHAIEKPAMNSRTVVAARIRRAVSSVFEAMRSPRAGVLGAKTGFVLGGALLLVSKVQWWYFTESMGLLILGAMAGSVVFMVGNRAAIEQLEAEARDSS